MSGQVRRLGSVVLRSATPVGGGGFGGKLLSADQHEWVWGPRRFATGSELSTLAFGVPPRTLWGDQLSCLRPGSARGLAFLRYVLFPPGMPSCPLGPIPLLGSSHRAPKTPKGVPGFNQPQGVGLDPGGQRGSSRLDGAPRATPAPSDDGAPVKLVSKLVVYAWARVSRGGRCRRGVVEGTHPHIGM